MAELVKKISKVELVWDIKKILTVAILLLLVGGIYFAKASFLEKKESSLNAQVKKNTNEDRVAGARSEENLENEIEGIKKEIFGLTPADIIKQEPVKKIIQDLDNLKASVGAQLTEGAKNVVCEEVKRIFCSQ